MKKWMWVFAVILLVFLGLWITSLFIPKPPYTHHAEEKFIRENLMKKDGRITTELMSRKDVYLSETVGLWMEYLVVRDDRQSFEQQVKVLKKSFLTGDGLVTWKVTGRKKAPANAFIDDLRIMNALYDAGEQWSDSSYTELAEKMKTSLIQHQIRQYLFVDHVDLDSKHQAEQVTLSYVIPAGMEHLRGDATEAYEKTRSLLMEAPRNRFGFLPKTYYMQKHAYSFEAEVNMIDQLYMGLHRAQWGGDVSDLLGFIRESYERDGKVYGRYDAKGGKPVVDYEAVAVYALAILLALETAEHGLAVELYAEMKAMQQTDPAAPYFGGYIDAASRQTHPFDNLLALIAERKGYHAGIF